MTDRGGNGDGFHHEALFYADADELLAGTLPFVQEGVEAGEAVMVAMPRPNLELLKGHLNSEVDQVRFVDMEEVGRNPARLIATWWDFLAPALRERCGARGVGEPIWRGRSAAELDEGCRHESLLNVAFVDAKPLKLLCPYDAVNLSDEVLQAAEHNHPALFGSRERSVEYGETVASNLFAGELEPPRGRVDALSFGEADLHAVRSFVHDRGRDAGFEGVRLDDLVLAANEIATNSLRHGGGSGELQIWTAAGALSCDFRDAGRFDDPLVGRRRPSRSQIDGRGLWIANQLCDLVQIRSDQAGSMVRLQMAV